MTVVKVAHTWSSVRRAQVQVRVNRQLVCHKGRVHWRNLGLPKLLTTPLSMIYYLQFMTLSQPCAANSSGLRLTPVLVMEIHVHMLGVLNRASSLPSFETVSRDRGWEFGYQICFMGASYRTIYTKYFFMMQKNDRLPWDISNMVHDRDWLILIRLANKNTSSTKTALAHLNTRTLIF